MTTQAEVVRAWKALEENIAWMALVSVIKDQMEARAHIILKEPLTPEKLYDREMLRGERNGLELVLSIAETSREQAEADLAEILKEMKDETEIQAV